MSDIQASGRSQYLKNERDLDTVIKNYFGRVMQRKKRGGWEVEFGSW
jgi:hypothetical protein